MAPGPACDDLGEILVAAEASEVDGRSEDAYDALVAFVDRCPSLPGAERALSRAAHIAHDQVADPSHAFTTAPLSPWEAREIAAIERILVAVPSGPTVLPGLYEVGLLSCRPPTAEASRRTLTQALAMDPDAAAQVAARACLAALDAAP